MSVLCFNSFVAHGHVGGRADLFLLERAGLPVCLLPTVVFSNHPAHGGFAGEAMPASSLEAMLDGLVERGLLDGCRMLLTGYLGTPETVSLAARTRERLAAASPRLVTVCDPVIGDGNDLYVPEAVARAIGEHLAPRADLLTPNRFEALWLTGKNSVEAALEALPAPAAVISSARERGPAGDGGEIVTLWRDGRETGEIVHRRHRAAPHGTGDALTALLAAGLLAGQRLPEILEEALAALERLIAADPEAKELDLPGLVRRLDAPADGR